MMTSKSLIFFGNERLSSGFSPNGAPTLQLLIDNGYNVKAVVANHEVGRSRKPRPLEIEAIAKKHGIPLLLPDKPIQVKEQLVNFGAETAVLVAYGRIVPQEIIDIFPKGIINIHPSLLPKYRGSTPIEQAILDGATQTGVSIMQLVKAMDAGPLYAQTVISLKGNETKQELTQRLLQLGGQLIIDNLPGILDGTAVTTPQDDSLATFTSLIRKSDGIMDLAKPAEQLEREIRAYAVWPKSRTTIGNHDVTVTRARIAQSATDGELVLTCQPGWLEILELTAPSGKTMSGADFIRGYGKSA